MDDTPNLKLPYIAAAQAQKHVTHNEAIRNLDAIIQLSVIDKDLTSPPGSPSDGDRYIPATGSTGAWAGWDFNIAAYQDGAWLNYSPAIGWVCWVADEAKLFLWNGSVWADLSSGSTTDFVSLGDTPADYAGSADKFLAVNSAGDAVEFILPPGSNFVSLSDTPTDYSAAADKFLAVNSAGDAVEFVPAPSGTTINPASLVGVNTTADTTNRLAVSSPATLLNHEGDDHQLKINKADTSDTAALLMQNNFSGRAEIGLLGNDDFRFKVSPDGTTYFDGIVIDKDNGVVDFPNGTTLSASGISPAGMIGNFAMNSAPSGWLKADGAEISRSTYATLFAVTGTIWGVGDGSTTFNLPDLRGEFFRGWDDGRGVDSGRAFASTQGDEFKSHYHTGTQRHGSSYPMGGGGGSAKYPTNGAVNTSSTGGTETRPRNIALLACIKY